MQSVKVYNKLVVICDSIKTQQVDLELGLGDDWMVGVMAEIQLRLGRDEEELFVGLVRRFAA